MKLTANTLQLYRSPGREKAAAEINAAATKAVKAAIKVIGKRFYTGQEGATIAACIAEHTSEVMLKHKELGACDSEPLRAVNSAVAARIGKHYGLDDHDINQLYYSL